MDFIFMAQQSGSFEYYGEAKEVFSDITNTSTETMQYQISVEAEILKFLHSYAQQQKV